MAYKNTVAILLDADVHDQEASLALYSTLFFIDQSPPLLWRRHLKQDLIIAIRGQTASEYGHGAKQAWHAQADAVLVPSSRQTHEQLMATLRHIKYDTHNLIRIVVDMATTTQTREEEEDDDDDAAFADSLDVLQKAGVCGVTLHSTSLAQRARALVQAHNWSLRLYGLVRPNARAIEVHAMMEAGVDEVIVTGTKKVGGSVALCAELTLAYSRAYGVERARLRDALVDTVQVIQHVPKDTSPFVTKSGLVTNVYVDMRRLVAYPKTLHSVAQALLARASSSEYDCIAGVPTGAVPLATVMSQCSGIPLIMLREQPKAYGMRNQIEGVWQPGQRCLLVEDVTTTGSSILTFLQILRQHGLDATHAVVVLARDTTTPRALLAQHHCTLDALYTLDKTTMTICI